MVAAHCASRWKLAANKLLVTCHYVCSDHMLKGGLDILWSICMTAS